MKTSRHNIHGYTISILSTIFVLGISFLIVYFSKGYRINILNREIKKTGVLTVQTEPNTSRLYINEQEIGRTPRSKTLDIGTYKISVWKEGYRDWNKNIDIVEEKSTPIFPFLLMKEIKKSTIWETEETLEKYWLDHKENFFIYTLANELGNKSIWTYRINTSLWNLNPNPSQILSIQEGNIDLNISPNGQLAILTLTTQQNTLEYILETTKTNTLENMTPLDSLEFLGYTKQWAKDSRHIILESEQDIISLDTVKNIKYLLLKKNPDTIQTWQTDEEGFFYTIQKSEDENTYIYTLKQTRLDGTYSKDLIEQAYFQKNPEYISHYRENTTTYPSFKNSPESTQAIGQIISFDVNQTSKGVFIKTDTSTYWYDITTNRYLMISPYSGDLLKYSPDSTKLLLANGENIYVFTYDKDEADHTETIGTKKIENILKEEIQNINWLSNSSYLHYTKNNNIFISDKDGDNQEELIPTQNILLYTIRTSREYIATLETSEQKTSINLYRIH